MITSLKLKLVRTARGDPGAREPSGAEMESQSSTPIVVQRVRAQALGDLLRRSALRYPDKLALVSGELRWTYAAFDGAVRRTAAALSGRVEKGDRLALLDRKSVVEGK